jgi:hypothetical protein
MSNREISATERAITDGHTVYRKSVKTVDALGKTENVIKRSTNAKIGKTVTRGQWASMPIYTVTLEERATCTRACIHWADCYGNNMPFATRYAAGTLTEDRMEAELATLQKRHPRGFVVRLHVLGDFYSVTYVAKWARWLGMFPALRVYGYTHHKAGTSIGDAVRTLAGDRWQVRVSGDASAPFAALSADQPEAVTMLASKAAFACPEQQGKVKDCGACALCWTARKPVVFVTH